MTQPATAPESLDPRREPLLAFHDARIEDEGVALAPALRFEARGARIALVGRSSALFRLWSGQARLFGGSARVLGTDAESAACSGLLGLALADVPLPTRPRTIDYLALAAQLRGIRFWAAKRSARSALAKLGLESLEKKRLGMLGATERRGVVLAQALLGNPKVVAIERPFSGMDDASALVMLALVRRAGEGRSLVISLGSPSFSFVDLAVLRESDQSVVIKSDGSVATLPRSLDPSAANRYALYVTSGRTALVAELERRGISVSTATDPGRGDAGHLAALLLGTHSTADLLDAAREVRAPVVELLPIELDFNGVTATTT